ncbi:hypothetical protein Aduo_008543 [Ancylostoma duodenale]
MVKIYRCPEDIEEEWLMGEVSAVFLFSPAEYAAPCRWSTAWLYLLIAVNFGTDYVAWSSKRRMAALYGCLLGAGRRNHTPTTSPNAETKMSTTKLGQLTQSKPYVTVTAVKSEGMANCDLSRANRFWDIT